MLPDKCSIREGNKDCVDPPAYVITVVSNNDEFMLGITCEKHKTSVFSKIKSLQSDGKIPKAQSNLKISNQYKLIVFVETLTI